MSETKEKEFTHVIADSQGFNREINIGDRCRIINESGDPIKIEVETQEKKILTQYFCKEDSKILPIMDLKDYIDSDSRHVFETRFVSDSEAGDYPWKTDKWIIPDDYLEKYLSIDKGYMLKEQANERAKELAKQYFAPFPVKFAGKHICVKVTKEMAEQVLRYFAIDACKNFAGTKRDILAVFSSMEATLRKLELQSGDAIAHMTDELGSSYLSKFGWIKKLYSKLCEKDLDWVIVEVTRVLKVVEGGDTEREREKRAENLKKLIGKWCFEVADTGVFGISVRLGDAVRIDDVIGAGTIRISVKTATGILPQTCSLEDIRLVVDTDATKAWVKKTTFADKFKVEKVAKEGYNYVIIDVGGDDSVHYFGEDVKVGDLVKIEDQTGDKLILTVLTDTGELRQLLDARRIEFLGKIKTVEVKE